MNLELLDIVSSSEGDTFQVVVEIDRVKDSFNINLDRDVLNGQPLHIFRGDDRFRSLFQWERGLAEKIYEIVSQFYDGKHLNFPISLGELDLTQEPVLN